MPRIQVYLDQKEYAFAKTKRAGYIRSLVRADMSPAKAPVRPLSSQDLCRKA